MSNAFGVHYFEQVSDYYYLQMAFDLGLREKIMMQAGVQDVKHI